MKVDLLTKTLPCPEYARDPAEEAREKNLPALLVREERPPHQRQLRQALHG
eukprot:CAMPEP_0172039542 /NCGR_PEP_ID=MMETSP1041-20130122/23961_1 /TAXON_ID=464988 /ORGANISM="Hemiselmis andersenii, Strain CCMP439" /LENGTH=50 /DNA_ID=CAMNT_0012697261 /DNA_START=255 /DNA_END=403 /DNA_ORIENTATION=-